MSNQEANKHFGTIRNYVRQFFVGGFKTTKDFDSNKQLKTVKNKVRICLGNSMEFTTKRGKQIFLTTGNRSINTNPFYDLFKTKSITRYTTILRFLILDILSELESLSELKKLNPNTNIGFEFKKLYPDMYISPHLREMDLNKITENDIKALIHMRNIVFVDGKTIESSIDNLVKLGLITKTVTKTGRTNRNTYRITKDSKELTSALKDLRCAIKFFSESDPLGVIGYYTTEMLDRPEFFEKDYDLFKRSQDLFRFKQKYISRAVDSENIYKIVCAIKNKWPITITVTREDYAKNELITDTRNVFPYKIYISSQNGRLHLFYWECESEKPSFVRIDQIENISITDFDDKYKKIKDKFWGVSSKYTEKTEHIEFVVEIGKGEHRILNKFINEKRCGKVTLLENYEDRWKFSADVYDSRELIVWIRTFIGRIVSISCENEEVMNRLQNDFNNLYATYNLTDGGEDVGII